MDISPFVESLRQDLVRAAEAGGPEARGAAERLVLALEPAVRLNLMEALSQAAAEISGEAGGLAVEVRLRGREPVFVVTGEPAAAAPPAGASDEPPDFDAPDPDTGEGEELARITLRIPEPLKTRAEALAARRGQSLNSWLVGAARAAAAGGDEHRHGPRHRFPKRVQGWAR
jgi:hypothetical protein